MKKDINVIVLEDDYFSLYWMSMIIARDWRTRLVADVANDSQLKEALQQVPTSIDLVIIDAEIYRDLSWVGEVLELLWAHSKKTKVIFTTITPRSEIIDYLKFPSVRGYLTKEGVKFSLAWAAEIAAEDTWVLTPQAESELIRHGFILPHPRVIIEGQDEILGLNEDQADAARLAFIFSMERSEVADELSVSNNWGCVKVSDLYKRIGVKDVLEGESTIEEFLGSNPIIVSHFKEIMASFSRSKNKKAKQMETLAFHYLTKPLTWERMN